MDTDALVAFPRILGVENPSAPIQALGLPLNAKDLRSKWHRGTPSVAVDTSAPQPSTGNNVRPKPQQKADQGRDGRQPQVPTQENPSGEKMYAPLPVMAAARLRPVPVTEQGQQQVSVDPTVLLASPFGIVSAWNPAKEVKTVLLRRSQVPVAQMESKVHRLAAIDSVSYRTAITITEGGNPSLSFRGGRGGRGGFRGRGGMPPPRTATTRTVEKTVHLVASVSNGYVGLFVWDGGQAEIPPTAFKPVLPVSADEGFECENIGLAFSPSGTQLAVWRQQRIMESNKMQEVTMCVINVALGSGNLGMSSSKVPWTPAGCTTCSWVTDELMAVNDRRFGTIKLYALVGHALVEIQGPGGSGAPGGWQVTAPVIRTLKTIRCSQAKNPTTQHPMSIDFAVVDFNNEIQHVRLLSSDASLNDPNVPVAAVSSRRAKRNRDELTLSPPPTGSSVAIPVSIAGGTSGENGGAVPAKPTKFAYSLMPLSASLDAAHLHHHGVIEHVDVVPSTSTDSASITVSSSRKGNLSTTLLQSTVGHGKIKVVKNWTQALRVASAAGIHKCKLPLVPSPAAAFAFPGKLGTIVMVHDEFCGTI